MWTLENWNQEKYTDFVAYLKQLEDLDFRNFHKGLLPGIEHIIGIRTPVLRNIAKEIVLGNGDDFLRCAQVLYHKEMYYEETMIEGMVIGFLSLKKSALPDQIKGYIQNFAKKINNWAVCDIFCAGMKGIKNYQEEFWEFILEYVEAEEEYQVRMGIVLLMDYYLDDVYIDAVLEHCDRLNTNDYYINMAVAWLISLAYLKFEDKTMNFLNENHLSDITYNKALQKIVESNRVMKEKKELIRSMKRKK